MGIRGLTTFIQNKSHLYLEKYELHGTNVVIDGNAVAHQLYKWHCKSNDCFGGDYDKFANSVINFFQILSECNVTPYVVFDGGYETRKIATVISRMKNKIKSATELNSATEDSISVFPLFLRETFQDIVLKLNIKCVTCDFEGDTETASIARTLNCPVISYDSDFFIFDVLYIPFSTFKMCVRRKENPQSKETYSYIFCKIYRVEKFLNSFGGMDKTNLPILAVLLGNDYVKRSAFSSFFRQLKIHGGESEQQKRIKSLIIWLQNETVESAVRKVLSRYKCKERKQIAEKIQNAIKGYYTVDSRYLKYLEITPVNPDRNQAINVDYANDIKEENIDDALDKNISNSDEDDDQEENSSCEEEELDFSTKSEPDVPKVFLENFRKCLYPPNFMNILTQNKYYCIPQVEDDYSEYSHAICSEILSAIHKILKGSKKNLICIARNEFQHGHVKQHVLPYCSINVPSIVELKNMSLESRKNVLLKVLNVNENFVKNCVSFFPESWQLFIITLKYLTDKTVTFWPLLYSLVLCKIFLSYVDSRVGICRSFKSFNEKFRPMKKNVLNNDNKECNSSEKSITESLDNISFKDSLVCLENFVSYFQTDVKMKSNSRLFNRNVVHLMAQFQSCFLHIKYLNNLLNLPYSNFIISDFYNGTFVYNLTLNFAKRVNLDSYIKIRLESSPTVLNALTLIVDKIKEHSSNNVKSYDIPKRRKKKKIHKEVCTEEKEEHLSEEEFVFDPNNKFSLLAMS